MVAALRFASGSGDGRHVALLQADPEKWTDFDEVLRVNPVARSIRTCGAPSNANTRPRLNPIRAARTFRQFRLNIPGDPVDSQPLITTAEFEAGLCSPGS